MKPISTRFFIAILIALAPYVASSNSCDGLAGKFETSTRSGENVYMGMDIRSKLSELISSAKSSIEVQTLYIKDPQMLDLFLAKASEGVKIKIMMDGNWRSLSEKYRERALVVVKKLNHPNISLRFADNQKQMRDFGFPVSIFHRKMVVVDGGERFVVMSSNLSNEQAVDIGLFGSEGGKEAAKIFENDWKGTVDAEGIGASAGDNLIPEVSSAETPKFYRFIGPGTKAPDLRHELSSVINSAKSRIYLALYEGSDPAIIQEIISAKQRNPNLDLKVVLCGTNINFWAPGGFKLSFPKNRMFLKALADQGIPVRIFNAPNDARLHARLGIFDEQFYLGSADFTRTSAEGNVDLGVIGDGSKNSTILGELTLGFNEVWEESTPTNSLPSRRALLVDRALFYFRQIWIYSYRLLNGQINQFSWNNSFDPFQNPAFTEPMTF